MEFIQDTKLAVGNNGDLLQIWTNIEQFYKKRMWNALTKEVEEYTKHRSAQINLDLYYNFISSFESKISPVDLVRLITRIIFMTKTSPEDDRRHVEEGLALLNKIGEMKKVKSDAEAHIINQILILKIQLQKQNKKKETQDGLTELQPLLDKIEEDSLAHTHFYLLVSDLARINEDLDRFYGSSIEYLDCTKFDDLTTLRPEDKKQMAFDICVAALLSQKVQDFDEILQHTILQELTDPGYIWIVDVLRSFQDRDMEKFGILKEKWGAEDMLNKNEEHLFKKFRMMAGMEPLESIDFPDHTDPLQVGFKRIVEKNKLNTITKVLYAVQHNEEVLEFDEGNITETISTLNHPLHTINLRNFSFDKKYLECPNEITVTVTKMGKRFKKSMPSIFGTNTKGGRVDKTCQKVPKKKNSGIEGKEGKKSDSESEGEHGDQTEESALQKQIVEGIVVPVEDGMILENSENGVLHRHMGESSDESDAESEETRHSEDKTAEDNVEELTITAIVVPVEEKRSEVESEVESENATRHAEDNEDDEYDEDDEDGGNKDKSQLQMTSEGNRENDGESDDEEEPMDDKATDEDMGKQTPQGKNEESTDDEETDEDEEEHSDKSTKQKPQETEVPLEVVMSRENSRNGKNSERNQEKERVINASKYKRRKGQPVKNASSGKKTVRHKSRKVDALREIKKYQRSTEFLLSKASFQRVVRETANQFSHDNDLRFQTHALYALQEASELFMSSLFESAQVCAVHGKRITVYKKDIHLSIRLRTDIPEDTMGRACSNVDAVYVKNPKAKKK